MTKETPVKTPKARMSRRRALKFATIGAGAIGAATMAANPAVGAVAVGTSIAEDQGEDRTAEIQTALDEAFESGGGSVLLEEGTFNISSSLIIRANVTLMGCGAGTRIRATGTNFNWMIQLPANSHAASVRSMRIFGANVAGGIQVVTAGGGSFSGQDSYALIENVFLHDLRTNGVRVGFNFDTREVRLHNVVVLRANAGHGIQFNAVDSIISNCTTAGASGSGLLITGGNNRVTGHKSFFCGGSGISITGSRNQLSACQAQDNSIDGFRIEDAQDVCLSACNADSNGFVGFRIRRCEAVAASAITSLSRPGGVGEHVFGVRIQDSSMVRVTGVSRGNATNFGTSGQTNNVDANGLLS